MSFFKRKQIVVNAKLQYGIVLFFVGLTTLNAVYIFYLLRFLKTRVSTDIELLLSVDDGTRTFLISSFDNVYDMIFKYTSIFSAFIIIFSFITGVVFLNHVAGPIHAVKNALRELIESNKTRSPLRFRKYDFFNDVADLINQLNDKINKTGK